MKIVLFTLLIMFNLVSPNSNLIIADKPDCIGNGMYLTDWEYKAETDSSWLPVSFDNNTKSMNITLQESQIHWLQTVVKLCDSSKIGSTLYIHIANLRSAYQIFWDGKLIGKNGIFDSTGNVREYGNVCYSPSLKYSSIVPSRHFLSIRFAYDAKDKERLNFVSWIGFTEIRPYLNTNYFMQQIGYITISLIGTVLGLALFFAGGSFRNYLFLVPICLPVFLIRLYRLLTYYLNFSTNFYVTMYVTNYFFFLSQLSIITFFIIIFNLRFKPFHILLVALILLCQDFNYWFYDSVNSLIADTYWLGIICYAIYKKKSGSLVALSAFLIYYFPEIFHTLGFSLGSIYYHASYWFFIITLFIVPSRQVYQQNVIRKKIEARSKRLESELLKKTIQPHFIANSLSAVRSLSKTNPDKANKLVQAISNEFYLLNKVISELEISVTQEIELCKYHLEVMGYRRDATYKLQTDDIPDSAKIPPLVIHTLIENGVTHSLKPKEEGLFIIKYNENETFREFIIKNNGSRLEDKISQSELFLEEGLGYKYIKSRLEEIYSGKWELKYGITDGFWETKIKIYS